MNFEELIERLEKGDARNLTTDECHFLWRQIRDLQAEIESLKGFIQKKPPEK